MTVYAHRPSSLNNFNLIFSLLNGRENIAASATLSERTNPAVYESSMGRVYSYYPPSCLGVNGTGHDSFVHTAAQQSESQPSPN